MKYIQRMVYNSGAALGMFQHSGMKTLSLPVLVVSALIFLLVLFWVQTLYYYWQIWFGGTSDEIIPSSRSGDGILTFTIFLTIVVLSIVFLMGQTNFPQEKGAEREILFGDLF